MICRDYFEGVLERRDLWLIFELDEKWKALKEKKTHLRQIFDASGVTDYYFDDLLHEYKDEDEIKDLMDYFKQRLVTLFLPPVPFSLSYRFFLDTLSFFSSLFFFLFSSPPP